jgi:fructokinase
MRDNAQADAAKLFGCIEAGGTKFVLGVTNGAGTILRRHRIDTRKPDVTIKESLGFFRKAESELGHLSALGIASFGPAGLDPASAQWGHVLDTPKPHWSGTPLAQPFIEAFGCPAGFDTDVNGAILAEHLWGAAQGVDVAIYVTVGTGIGGGAIIHGRPLHGLHHPEMGHIWPVRHPADEDFIGTCPYHGDCLEGLACGPTIQERWQASLSQLPEEHVAHDIIAFYLAQLVVTQQALLSPGRIVLGGGVLATPGLLARVRHWSATLAQGYFGLADQDYARLIVPPGLGDDTGLLGALALARQALGAAAAREGTLAI